ncbi:MAG: hypothetical protein DRM98_03835 [Thermoplasmata archaeon]|nr:MAG: zinc ribbon domain-containing protein [Thermoplasmata archaeon]RLF32442.1 MAG: hypothetical protein DRM98_03835 [Thermoplasmata archaeon]RLF51991.1 MAG: hypothetical protein DRN24_04010 [Thermoplasmata archaeon]
MEREKMQDYSKYKTIMRVVGIPLMIIGLIIWIFFFINFGRAGFESAQTNALLSMGGFVLFAIGVMLVRLSIIRPVSKYYATELSPAMEIAGQSIGKGLNQSGFGKSKVKEVIKIKCPHCGYLESEDAEFCSKCGKKL